MLNHRLNIVALLPQKKIFDFPNLCSYHFKNKRHLLELIEKIEFDILISNGCPYILPVSQIKKNHQLFVNIHPSLLPNLKGPHPINGAILLDQKTGATCHIMNDNVDDGEIISQTEIQNNSNIDLPLLYQMCFLAEIQAFQLALSNNFNPQTTQNNTGNYFKRDNQIMQINFAFDDTSTIIKKVQAFNIKNQYAKLLHRNQTFSIKTAKIITNTFLSSFFKNKPNHSVVLVYEDFILVKKDEDFLQLEIVEEVKKIQNGELLIQSQSIYQTTHYSLCSSYDNFKLSFSEKNNVFYNLSEITQIPNTPYKDMSSPYGYSGYFTNSLDLNFIKKAIDFQSLQAEQKNIIAEFIRFNPYQNHKIFSDFLDFYTLERQMVEVSTNYQTRWENYHPRLRSKIRKSLSTLQIHQSNNLGKFLELYTQTMQRNQAQDFYFFTMDYFQKLSKLDGFVMYEAIYAKEICAMAIFLCDNDRSYYHLGANSSLTLLNNLNAMGAIFEVFFQYAEQKGIISCLLGGGRSSDPDDSLLQYKKQYSPTLIDFYIGGKIYDHQIYQELSKNFQNNFFLKYRFHQGRGG